MLKAVFKTQLIPADSPLLTHSSAMLFRRGGLATVCQNTASTLSRLESFLKSTECHRQSRSLKHRRQTELSGLSVEEEGALRSGMKIST